LADITLVNLNMLYIRYFDTIDREKHVPLGPLYVVSALEKAGFTVDFRDYQLVEAEDPFDSKVMADFLSYPAPVLGISTMTNLLPFTILAMKEFKERHPDVTVILGGVGTKSIESEILKEFPWIDIIVRGEGEITSVELMKCLKNGGDLKKVPGISFRENGSVIENRDQRRIENLDDIDFPAFHKINLRDYRGYGVITSRGCPYPCTFCSVAPIWGLKPYLRSNESIISEMKYLHEKAGVNLFLFQDEFFLASPARALAFSKELQKTGLSVKWKAFGRVDLTNRETMEAMARSGCIELRFGIESGSDKVLRLTKKGFTSEEATKTITEAVQIFPRVDTFFVWGFPFEDMEDFYQSVFQMISFRMMGARILPSLLSLLPQTEIYREYKDKTELEFCEDLFPEYMITGHEISNFINVSIADKYKHIFEFIKKYPGLFPGFFHIDLKSNVFPKLEVLRQYGFYPPDLKRDEDSECCAAHSPDIIDKERSVLSRPGD